jgi:hypothetical protein
MKQPSQTHLNTTQANFFGGILILICLSGTVAAGKPIFN